MSQQDLLPFTCPRCGRDFLAEVWTVINVDQTPALRDLVASRNLNVVPCDHCDTAVFVPVPVVYYDRRARWVACFVPDAAEGSLEVEETVELLLAQLAEDLQEGELPAWAQNPEIVEETTYLAAERHGVRSLQGGREPELDLAAALQALSAVSSEEELVRVFNEHPELMTPEAHGLLHRVVQQAREQGQEEVATYFANVLDFLTAQAPADGEDLELETLDESSDSEAALHALVQVTSLDEVEEVLEAYPELLSPQAVNALRRLAHRMREAHDPAAAARLSTVADLIDDWLTALALEVIAEDEA
jgi:hypothetical protein